MKRNAETIARDYLDAVATKRLDRLETLLAPDVSFVGPAASHSSREAVIAALRRVSSIHVRNDIKRVFADADDVCVIYDFVTDAIGTLPTIEWLTIADDRIKSIRLYYDQMPWQRARDEIARRAQMSANG